MEIKIQPLMDIDAVMRWRREVVREVFGREMDDSLLSANHIYLRKHIAEGTHYPVMALADGVEVGCGSACFQQEMPSPDNPTGLTALLMNIYVRPQWRRKGVGSAIVDALTREAERRGAGRVFLESTDKAVALYREAGFDIMPNWMVKTL